MDLRVHHNSFRHGCAVPPPSEREVPRDRFAAARRKEFTILIVFLAFFRSFPPIFGQGALFFGADGGQRDPLSLHAPE